MSAPLKKRLLAADKILMQNTLSKRMLSGFTTTELMIVAALITILTALAVPNYSSYLANNRAANLAMQINTALRLAKNEALHRHLSVELCAIASAGGVACDNTASNWQFGWQVAVLPLDTIVYTYVPNTPSAITIVPASSITFSPNGFPSPQAYTITIKPPGCTRGYIISFNATAANGQLKTQTTPCP
ncbi:MAG TPA: GspH/FimT family pseudopilin [Gammaproteobacteria bacterium]|nr:GspH/FimT family pseudopilin [Gammaproteobacteria bacterium]